MTAAAELSGNELALLVAAVASSALWLLAAMVVHAVRRPAEPPSGPRTMDLGPEPPAVANFLVNDFRVTRDAVPATLLDLAARGVVEIEQRGPGVSYVRLRRVEHEDLTEYERRVLGHLENRASDDVVPAEALTTGPADESSRWWRGFTGEVVADAQRRGLSRDLLDKPIFIALAIATAVPALLVGALAGYRAGLAGVAVGVAILSAIRSRHRQRETPAGLDAASRWLGVREELADNEVFETHAPITVALWERYLSYGAALGVAAGAVGPLRLGTESDRLAWSSYSGRWRPVRISYPSSLPLGWGQHPLRVLVWGVASSAVAGLSLYFLVPLLIDTVSESQDVLVAGAVLLPPSVFGLVAVTTMARSLGDLASTREVTGPILRLRLFGSKGQNRYYVAVDDGASAKIRAWRIRPELFAGLEQGEVITVSLTPHLRYVRALQPVGPPAPSAA